MLVNARALIRVAGIGCLLEEGCGPARPARVALATEETVRAARALGASDPDLRVTHGSPQIRYGGALAYVDMGQGPARRLVLDPGEGDGFRLPCGLRFLGRNMFAAEGDLPDRGEGERPFLRSLIRSVLRLVAAVPDPDRFPEHLISQAFRSSLREAFGEARLPLSDDQLILKSRSDLIRSRIGSLDPKHPDALHQATPLTRILDSAGLDVRADGVEVPDLGRITRFEARRLTKTAPYRSGLFERLTRTPPARIGAVVLPIAEARALESALSGSRLSGAWPDGVSGVLRGLTGTGPGGLGLTLSLHVSRGRDLLLMTDTVGEMSGVSLLFSWPTHERAPVLSTPEGPVYALCPEEAPAPEELIRLDRALYELILAGQSLATPKQALDA